MAIPLPIETPRLVLRDFVDSDLPAYQRLRSQPVFGRHYANHETTAAFSADLLQRFIGQQQDVPRQYWQLAIVRREDGVLLGSVGLRSGFRPGEARFGIELDESAWGQGYAQEAARPMIDFGFNRCGFRRIEADIAAANQAAQLLASRLGFSDGEVRNGRIRRVLSIGMLGAETEWRLLGDSATLRRLEGGWQLSTPTEAAFYFGNALYLDQAPGDRRRWEARFDQAFAGCDGIGHYTFVWSGNEGGHGFQREEWINAGYDYTECQALVVSSTTFAPVPPNPDIRYRRFATADDWRQWQDVLLACRDAGHEEEDYRGFLQGRMRAFQTLAQNGQGDMWGAFDGDELLATAGLFHWEAFGRFQLVATVPHARKRGLARQLLSVMADWGLARVPCLVIVAETDYHAIELYRKLGFVGDGVECSLCWWPRLTTGQ